MRPDRTWREWEIIDRLCSAGVAAAYRKPHYADVVKFPIRAPTCFVAAADPEPVPVSIETVDLTLTTLHGYSPGGTRVHYPGFMVEVEDLPRLAGCDAFRPIADTIRFVTERLSEIAERAETA